MPLKDPEAHKAYLREYAQNNKAYARVKAWRAANPEKRAAQVKRYAEKYPEKVSAKSIRWKKNNPEKAAQVSKATRIKNPARILANKAKYRASKRNRTPAWITPEDLEVIRCFYAVAKMYNRESNDSWHVDHVIPLNGKNVSGLHVPENLSVVRAKENHLKNNKYEAHYA